MTIDHETIEALRGEPELLAIADALQTAGDRLDVPPARARHRARLRPVRLAAVALALAAVVAVVLASPWSGSGGPSFVDKARAAVGDGPVLHVVLRYSVGERIDLRTGLSSPAHRDAEVWYDSSRRVYRAVSRLDGHVVYRSAGRGDLRYEPFMLSSIYRGALESGKLRKTGETVIRGRRAIVVESKLPHGGRMRASLDARTYQLLRLQFIVAGRLGSQIDVLRYETVSREQAHLPSQLPATSSSGYGSATVNGTERGSGFVGEEALAKARTAFGRPAIWPGRSIGGHPLIASQLERQSMSEDGRKPVHGQMLTLEYGPRDRAYDEPYVEVQEAPTGSPLWAIDGVYAPPRGYLDLTSGQTSTNNQPDRTQWTGVMRRNGFTIQLTSWSRSTLIAAARALRPLP